MKRKFLIIGSGYRAAFYARIALGLPEMYEVPLMYCRSDEKAAKMRKLCHIFTTTSIDDCLAYGADFAVVAVNKASIAKVSVQWAGYGIPVLAETPIGMTSSDLKLVEDALHQGRHIECAEQYRYEPVHSAWLSVLKTGIIGEVSQMTCSAGQYYHGFDLITSYLQSERIPCDIHAFSYSAPLIETDSREGLITDRRKKLETRTSAVLKFENGKQAFYDYTDVQDRSLIRRKYFNVRGTAGEITNARISFVNQAGHVENYKLKRKLKQDGSGTAALYLKDTCVYANPYPSSSLSDDETSMALCMDRLFDKRDPESIRDALYDAKFRICMEDAVHTPFILVHCQPN